MDGLSGNAGNDARPGRAITLENLTVIIPTLNEADNIHRFLSSLPPEVALIVVDSSDDETPELILEARPKRTQVIRIRANIPVARQLGAQAAETDWLLFSDADVSFASSYFENLTTAAVLGDTGGLVGSKASVDGFAFYHRWFTRGQAIAMAFGIPAATGSNMLVRADCLEQIGGFDSELSVNEDTELMFRIARAGYRVEFRPDLVVHAFDHRRLEIGLTRKVVHGAVRNTALYLGVFGKQVRSSDWGYWRERSSPNVGQAGPS